MGYRARALARMVARATLAEDRAKFKPKDVGVSSHPI
jgi:hypothetical protein